MALARRSSTRALARRRGLRGASCSDTPRVVRGGLGALIGGVLGAMVGGGVAVAVSTFSFDFTAPVDSVRRVKTMAFVGTGITILGAVGGLAIGAAKPEC